MKDHSSDNRNPNTKTSGSSSSSSNSSRSSSIATDPTKQETKEKQLSKTLPTSRSRVHPHPFPCQEGDDQDQPQSWSRFLHMARKSLHKQAKLVKGMECQKMVRKIKALRTDPPHANEETASSSTMQVQRRLHHLEQKLKWIKEFNMDCLVDEALRRLGLQVGVKNEKISRESNTTLGVTSPSQNGSNRLPVEDPNHPEDPESQEDIIVPSVEFTTTFMENMLLHKRLKTTMEDLNEQVTQYRKRISQKRDEQAIRESQRQHAIEERKNKKRKRNEKKTNHNRTILGAQKNPTLRKSDLSKNHLLGDSGMFIDSLSGFIEDQNHTREVDHDIQNHIEEYYDPAGEENVLTKKKNRSGQRQRKAKALAMEAKKQGKQWTKSMNWREKKKRSEDKDTVHIPSSSGLADGIPVKAQDIACMGKSWKEEGKAHPSWAAREALKAKSSIAVFTGKKITFD